MDGQISMDELLRNEEPPVKVEIPVAMFGDEKVYRIPDDVWEGRCKLCIHRNGAENIPVPIKAVHKPQYSEIIPCRIMTVSRPNDRPGECMSFAPRMDTYGICGTCIHNSIFHEGFCTKIDHAEEHRVYWGTDYGGDERKVDYYGRHRLSVCDDYAPDRYALEGKY
jgi:hypothetical protein